MKETKGVLATVPCDFCGEDLQTRKPDILLHAHGECRDKYLSKYISERNRYYRENTDALDDLRARIMNEII